MRFTSTRSLRDSIRETFIECRNRTLDLFEDIDATTFCQQAHPEFSPVGWHLGHVAFIEASWILEQCAGRSPLFPQYRTLFAADGLPKSERQNLPDRAIVRDYLNTVRIQVLDYLETAPIASQERLWRWLLQHESQHSEIITFILQLHRWKSARDRVFFDFPRHQASIPHPQSEMVAIPAGEFPMGWEEPEAQDNERPVHWIHLDDFEIDRYPVTCAQYREFMDAGGYQRREFWSEAGWKWLQDNPISQPLYWSESSDWDSHPVCGVSGYEAEAYARFAGKRLPTEAEWEKAASWDANARKKLPYPWGTTPPNANSCNHNTLVGHTTPANAYPQGKSPYGCEDLLGNVWEWTASWFDGYAGFEFYPYRGYSQVYFDRQHRVLRGGSWATRPWGLRASFRNWYHPGVRQILAGFRCAR